MSVSRLPLLLILLPILFGVAPQPKHRDIFSQAAADEIGFYAVIPCELCAVARSIGIDYPSSIESAGKGDVNAVRRLLRFTTTSALNAPEDIPLIAADSHSTVLYQLLCHIGDAKFAEALFQEPQKMRTAILTDLGWDKPYLTRWYPRTADAFTPNSTPRPPINKASTKNSSPKKST